MSESERVDAFTRCWHADVGRVTAYASRHVGSDAAGEVVSETFLQAWRRWDAVPEPALPWLLGIARKVIGNRRRGERRRDALTVRAALLDGIARFAESADVTAHHRLAALEALAALSETDREALLLVAWDGLQPDEAAAALGVRPATLRVRLHRARTRLDAALDAAQPSVQAHPSVPSHPEEMSWHPNA